ncbi:MAG: OmpA family protein [Spirochaetales bacterium]|nr:OmpA family protein [Spirochaetales bacterium]
MKKLYIALDGGNKLYLDSPDSFRKKKFRLRSVDKNQPQVRISMGVEYDHRDYSLHSVFLKNLSSSQDDFTYLDCSLERQGGKLFLLMKNRGRTVCQDSFSPVPRRILIRNILWVLLVFLLLGGLAGLLLTLDFSRLSGSSAIYNTQHDSTPVPSETKPVKPEMKDDSAPIVAEETKRETIPVESEPARPSEPDTKEKVIITESQALSEEQPVLEEEAEPQVVIEVEIPSPDFSLVDKGDLLLHFSPNNSDLDDESIESLKNVLSFLLEYPSLNVSITGHCAIAGTEAGRREISVQRAKNVETWLKAGGWKPEVPPIVRGEAGDYPLTRDPEDQEINRRVEIELSE